MTLQNRVDPFGAIRADPGRGLLMGNRGGRLHDSETRALTNRRHVSKAWIVCSLSFRGRRRRVMGDGYTELFFLDEATALAAGHRPCFECQRSRAVRFRDLLARAHGLTVCRAPAIDRILHPERLMPLERRLQLRAEDLSALPDGVMLTQAGRAFAIVDRCLWSWSFSGYTRFDGTADGLFTVLTPPSTLQVLRTGYRPLIHPSALEPS